MLLIDNGFCVAFAIPLILVVAAGSLYSIASKRMKESAFWGFTFMIISFVLHYGLIFIVFLANIFLVTRIDFWLLSVILKWIAILLFSYYLVGSIIEGFKQFNKRKADSLRKRLISGIGMTVGNFFACIYVIGEVTFYLIPVWIFILLLKYSLLPQVI